MGSKLHKMGEYVFSHPWRIISLWIFVLGIFGLLAFQFARPMSSAITIPGTEAQQTLTRMNELFPDAGKGSGSVIESNFLCVIFFCSDVK